MECFVLGSMLKMNVFCPVVEGETKRGTQKIKTG
jgi:hypothetical protein